MRIRQKAHIKDQIGVDRNAVLKAERDHIDGDDARLEVRKPGYNTFFKLHRFQAARIDDLRGKSLQLLQQLPLLVNPFKRSSVRRKRMLPPAFLVTLNKCGIGRIQK